ncbi:PREDICTED: dual specificity protein phosphatase 22-A-like isoform X1 [Calidris pugnax]|uniref:dual specificity protein phosphatase 22-A-like isoform X1 n=1 Tax=Calidris pugnax TaxID=198806 RepID=UPI00071CC003|nr:PREDICTED: dual specificity protein phosphatase 22-A-like isoform X1 [Calidris pugnax]
MQLLIPTQPMAEELCQHPREKECLWEDVSLSAGPTSGFVVGIPLPDAAPSRSASLAGVSRSTTILVAYLMTVTELGWEGCLAATKAVRSYVSPNFGFQQQLQEYEATLLQEQGNQAWLLGSTLNQGSSCKCAEAVYRTWIRRDYGRNPFKDQEELECLLAQQEQRQKEQQLGSRDCSWLHSPAPTNPLPSQAGGTGGSRWMNR